MKIAVVAAEVAPHAKEGGLADVIGALPGAFRAVGADPLVIVPGYRSILRTIQTRLVARGLSIRFGAGVETFSVLRGEDQQGVPMYLIDHPGFFDREGIYGEHGRDYPDNTRRFIFFGRAAALVAAELISP